MPLPFTQIRNFNNGLNTEPSNFLMPDTQVTESLNVHFDEIGSVTRRLGIATIGNQISAGQSILGLYNFISSDSTKNQLLSVVSGGGTNTVYYLNGATWSSTLTGDTVNLKTRFTTFLDRVIRVNGTDAIKCWSGTGAWETVGSPINPNTASIGKFIEVFGSRVYIAGNSSFPDRLYYSSLPSGNAISWSATNYIDINPNDGDNITALKRYASQLLIFKTNYLYRWNGSAVEPEPTIHIGTTSQESVVEGKGGIYFFHPKGIFVYAGGYPREISRPIDSWISSVSSANYDDVAAVSDRDHVYFFVGDVTRNSITYNNVCFRFTISSQTWTVYSYSDELIIGSQYRNGNSFTQAVGGKNGYVYTLNSGNSDNGSPIVFSLVTKYYEFGSLAHQFTINKLATFIRKGAGIHFAYQVDDSSVWEDNGMPELNSFVNVSNIIKIRGHRVRFKIFGSTATEPFVWDGLEVLEGEREGVLE